MHLGVNDKELPAFGGKAEIDFFPVVIHPAALNAAFLEELAADFRNARLGQIHFFRNRGAVNRLVVADAVNDMNACQRV